MEEGLGVQGCLLGWKLGAVEDEVEENRWMGGWRWDAEEEDDHEVEVQGGGIAHPAKGESSFYSISFSISFSLRCFSFHKTKSCVDAFVFVFTMVSFVSSFCLFRVSNKASVVLCPFFFLLFFMPLPFSFFLLHPPLFVHPIL